MTHWDNDDDPTEALVNARVARTTLALLDEFAKRRRTAEEAARRDLRGGCVVVVGAGASMSAGLPDWETFVGRFCVELLARRASEVDLRIARDIAEQVASRSKYARASTQILAQFAIDLAKSEFGGVEHVARKALYPENEMTSPLIEEIASWCRAGLAREVITFNYDDLLERELVRVGAAHQSYSPFGDTGGFTAIHHIHGYIPREGASRGTFVLSEESYESVLVGGDQGLRIRFVEALSSNPILLVGLSLADPHLRMVLRMTKSNSRRYAIMSSRSVFSNGVFPSPTPVAGDDSINARYLRDVLAHLEFDNYPLSLVDDAIRSLSVVPIWCDGYDAVASTMKALVR